MKGYVALFVISVGLRLAAFTVDMPFFWDVQTFQVWAAMLFEGGLSDFYYSDAFTDYPPMYMYVLWLVGAIRYALDLEFLSTEFNLLVFAPAIISDVITVLLLYRISRSFWVALAYSANPAVILNSSVWGQVDSIHTLLLFLAIYAVTKKQSLPVYLLYGIAVLTKPQSLIAAPVFLYSAFHYWKERGYSGRAALTMFGYAVAAFSLMAILSAPFGLRLALRQYVETVGQRPFATINAYNLYALFGGNWFPITPFFALVSAVAIVGVTFMAFWILHRHWNEAAVFFTAALLYIIAFVFSVRMNERYLFPTLLFLLAAFVFVRNKSDLRIPVLYAAFSATLFLNCLDVLLRIYEIYLFGGPPQNMVFRPVEAFVAFISFVNVALALYSLKFGRDLGRWADI